MDALLAALANGLMVVIVFGVLGIVAMAVIKLFFIVVKEMFIKPFTKNDDYVPVCKPNTRTGGVS